MIVIDPRVTETAAMADFHLRVRPGRDAWLARGDGRRARRRGARRSRLAGDARVRCRGRCWPRCGEVPIARYCEISGVDEALVRAATRRIAAASSVAAFEDLGVQMNRHSTLVSYLEKLVWLLTGNLAIPGGQYAMTGIGGMLRMSRNELHPTAAPVSPVVGAKVIGGLIPCNILPEEILADHPKRYRALIVESGNPVHSVADSQRMREAMRALDVSVCIDVFMTETARESDYVLPATTQFEKFEATFFNFDYPKNVFHLRRPVLDPPAGPLPEPEIHARLVAALGLLDEEVIEQLRSGGGARPRRVRRRRSPRPPAPTPASARSPPVLLYRTLGTDPPARRSRSGRRCGRWRSAAPRSTPTASPAPASAPDPTPVTGCSTPSSTARPASCSPTTRGRRPGSASRPTTVSSTSTSPSCSSSWPSSPTRRRQAMTREWPLLLSAGERRSFTANTIFRDPAWRKKDPDGALRVSPADAERIGLADGDSAKLSTKRAHAIVTVAVDDAMQPGHVSLPNGLGLDHVESERGRRPGRRRTSSPPARTATRGPARRGTSPCRLDSSRSEGVHHRSENPNATGEPMLDTYRDLSATATFNQWAGLEVVRMGEGECELRMPWRADEMGQYSGFLHAGLIAALLDTACGFAANTMARGGCSHRTSRSTASPPPSAMSSTRPAGL